MIQEKLRAGYVRTYTVEETIELIKANDGKIQILSLDSDLGVGFTEGRKVMDWIEEKAFANEIKYIPTIIIHSQNNVSVANMKMARYNAYKFWSKIKK
jgi:hypothetical protein